MRIYETHSTRSLKNNLNKSMEKLREYIQSGDTKAGGLHATKKKIKLIKAELDRRYRKAVMEISYILN